MTDWNMSTQDREQHAQRTQLGDAVKESQMALDTVEGELAFNKNTINGWRDKRQGYLVELEILNDKDEDTLGYDLRLRKLDLEKDAAELDGFISRSQGREGGMQHSIDMANLRLTKSKSAYTDFVHQTDGELSDSVLTDLHSIPRTSKLMTPERREMIIARYGQKVYADIPMI